MSTVIDMAAVASELKLAEEHSLTVEVVLWSLYAMRQDPSLSVTEALAYGSGEWIK